MINAAKLRGKRSGAELDKPVCLTLAPTGVAAYLVGGSTIESALGMMPSQQKAYLKCEPSKNSTLRFTYEDLIVLFIDEVSMLGSDMLARMNYRMQDIMGNQKFMGGVSIVSTGDFGQLPPVRQKMIWETTYIDNRLDISPNYWDENFKIYYLTEKMRSQDQEYSEICDKVRKGICDSEVIEYMERHIGKCPSEDSNENYQTGKFYTIVKTNKAREKINHEKLQELLPQQKIYYVQAIDKSTNNPKPPTLLKDLPHTRTGQLPFSIILKEGCPVMVTSNHEKKRYKLDGIVNGAIGYIDSIQPSLEDPDVAEVVWIKFADPRVGQLLRQDSSELLKFHKPNDKLAVPIVKTKKRFKVAGDTEYLREMFPLTICYSVTCHKSQGGTLDEVKVDYTDTSRNIEGSFYTSISRIRYGPNLYLRDFKPEYVKANPDVEKKIMSMQTFKQYNFKKTYVTDSLFVSNEEVKIGYLNVNDLMTSKSFLFIDEDINLKALDFLLVSDTRLNKDQSAEYVQNLFHSWSILARYDSRDQQKHMGMLLLKSSINHENRNNIANIDEKQYFKKEKVEMQIVFADFPEYNLKAAFVYVREKPTGEYIKILKNDLKYVDAIYGDLNLDPQLNQDRLKLDSLSEHRSIVLTEVTTVRFNQLDHIILDCQKFKNYFVTSYINYTTDHHVITSRIASKGNDFSEQFKQKRTFDVDKETPKRKRRKIEKREAVILLDNETEELNQRPNTLTDIDLSCLLSPNWLNDNVINTYLELLKKRDESIFMFSTFFHTSFQDGGFEKVQNYYRRHDILSYRMIFIPVHLSNHWFLITYDGSEIVSYDPYDFPGSGGLKKQMLVRENKQMHDSILENLKENYFKPLYSKYEKQWKDLNTKVLIPPQIPCQLNNHDCGVFLCMFAKNLILKHKFDFSARDMIQFRDTIHRELSSGKIDVSGNVSQRSARKRLSLSKKIPAKTVRFTESPSIVQRRFLNKDNATCWLNTNLQLVLTAFDFENNLERNGSSLWKNLIALKNMDSSIVLDPSEVKTNLIKTEKRRMRQTNIRAENAVFNLDNSDDAFNINSVGQQDAKDFWMCIDENQGKWEDLFDLFKSEVISETECSTCGFVSRQESSCSESSFIRLSCPTENCTMKQYFENKLNSFEECNFWRDEGGCGRITVGKNRTKILCLENVKYLVIIIDRLIQINGQFLIQETKVTVNVSDELNLTDSLGNIGRFKLLGVNEHIGAVTGRETHGHYVADVLNRTDNNWYHTSDSTLPVKINQPTDRGYIFLFKKSS